jgi:hypothetical protein
MQTIAQQKMFIAGGVIAGIAFGMFKKKSIGTVALYAMIFGVTGGLIGTTVNKS